MTLDPKALEAARIAHNHAKQRGQIPLAFGIHAYLDAADLVERNLYDKVLDVKGLVKERDEARRELDVTRKKYHQALDDLEAAVLVYLAECKVAKTRGAQIAALRGALEFMVNATEGGRIPDEEKARAVLTDTAEAVGEQKRDYDETQSAFSVVRERFFPDTDEARKEAERWRKDYNRAAIQCTDFVSTITEIRRQLAALREALEHSVLCITAARQAIYEAGGLQTYGPVDEHLKLVNAALIDTAKAAEGYQRVPEGWMVRPIEPTEEMYEAAFTAYCDSEKLFPALFKEIWEAMNAAAPQAGKGTGLDLALTDDQKDHASKLIEAQEKAYDPTTVIGGPQAGEGTE
jgi:hypothetical protein